MAPNPLSEADGLWDAGRKAEAVEIYRDLVDRNIASEYPATLERLITYYYEEGDKERARHYCQVAAEEGLILTLSPEPLANLYRQEKRAHFAKKSAPTGFAARVFRATPQQLEGIASGLREGFTIDQTGGWAVKASSYDDAYYVVAPISGPGIEHQIAAWWRHGDPSGPGLILSADTTAEAQSVFPNGRYSKAGAWHTDEDCKKLIDYVEDKTGYWD